MKLRRQILCYCALPTCGKRLGRRDPHRRGRPRRFCSLECLWRWKYATWRRLGHELGIVHPRWACPRWANCRVCLARVR